MGPVMKMIDQIKFIAGKYGLSIIYAFGSRASEIAAGIIDGHIRTRDSDSDVDIGVQPERGRRLSVSQKVRLTIDLEEVFQTHRVDLVVISEAGPFMALDIIRGEILFCRDPDEQAEQELYILRRAGDLAHFERERRDQILMGNA